MEIVEVTTIFTQLFFSYLKKDIVENGNCGEKKIGEIQIGKMKIGENKFGEN